MSVRGQKDGAGDVLYNCFSTAINSGSSYGTAPSDENSPPESPSSSFFSPSSSCSSSSESDSRSEGTHMSSSDFSPSSFCFSRSTRKRNLEKFAILTRKPRSHVRILIYQTRAIWDISSCMSESNVAQNMTFYKSNGKL